jgi:putative NADH-flavin reductase
MPDAAVITATGRTGSTCTQSGPYRSNRGAKVVIFVKQGDKFPTDADGASTTWTMSTSQ